MDYKEYKAKKDALNAELVKLDADYIAANREYQDTEIVLRHGKEVIIQDAYGVSDVTGGKVMYHYAAMNKDGTPAKQVCSIYGHEEIKPTGRFYFEDLL